MIVRVMIVKALVVIVRFLTQDYYRRQEGDYHLAGMRARTYGSHDTTCCQHCCDKR